MGGGQVLYETTFNVQRQKVVEKLDLISLKLAPIHVIYTLVFLLTFVNVMDKKQHIRNKIKYLFHIFSFSTVKKPLIDFPTFTTINWPTPFFWETNERIF